MISFDATICADLNIARRKEWLETNGLGGYASATIAGMNTRRYHALLVAARRPPVDRVVLLSKLEETLVIDGERFDLSTNQYPQTIFPAGYRLQQNFRLDPFPTFTFRVGHIELTKRVFMLQDENTTVVRYELQSVGLQPVGSLQATLELRPLVAFRDYHSLAHEQSEHTFKSETAHGLAGISTHDDAQMLWLAHDATKVNEAGDWYRKFEYEEERARGFDFREDLYNPCTLIFNLRAGATCNVIASTEKHQAQEAPLFEEQERERRRSLSRISETQKASVETSEVSESDLKTLDEASTDSEFTRSLHVAASQFIVRRGSHLATIIAGYHWFTDWGRDTMIALPGLTLATGKFDVAREILRAFAAHLSEGMIPNRFPDAGDTPEYNTVDATLWYVHAVAEYARRTGDTNFVREHLYKGLKEIIGWHERGTRYGIRVEADGLLRAGAEGVQLTWMDAKVGDWVVTPRIGKPVEIQALWYNALRSIEVFAYAFDDSEMSAHCNALASRARDSFNARFWNEAQGALFDVVRDDDSVDAALRPNQIFAVSLPHSMLSTERARRIVATVERELLTPYGLRSLSPHDADYRGLYQGDSLARDGAYHQGTVWAWLIGPFITAYLKVHTRSPASLAQARNFISAFRDHLSDAGLNQISEIFDGDAPHTPRGCIAQAWSVGELLRCVLEELQTN